MGLFSKSKKELIPEVGGAPPGQQYQQQGPPQPGYSRSSSSRSTGPPSIAPSTHSAAPSYRTHNGGYVPPSQGGQGYGQSGNHYSRPEHQPQHQQGYGQGQYGGGAPGGGDPYARGGPPPQAAPAPVKDRFGRIKKNQPSDEAARNELLAGAPAAGSSRYGGGAVGGQYGGGDPYGQQQQQEQWGGHEHGGAEQELDEDEEVEGIKQQMRFVKQESLASTRNAVRIAREAEETARATLDKLGDQSDRIANTERHLDLAKAHNDRAVDETKELEALNRSIFRPNITWNKQKKRDKEEQRILNRHNAEKEEREQTRRDQYESRQRMDTTYRTMDREAENAAGARARAKARGTERGRYQFEATASDDEVEDEIDNNLDEISGLAGRLKMLAMTAGQEVDAQNSKLGKLGNKVDVLDNNVVRSTNRLARVK